jgi:antitoxin (DNA-binding transcriptional repressor) of toxin-antitoxin stability system
LLARKIIIVRADVPVARIEPLPERVGARQLSKQPTGKRGLAGILKGKLPELPDFPSSSILFQRKR